MLHSFSPLQESDLLQSEFRAGRKALDAGGVVLLKAGKSYLSTPPESRCIQLSLFEKPRHDVTRSKKISRDRVRDTARNLEFLTNGTELRIEGTLLVDDDRAAWTTAPADMLRFIISLVFESG